MPVFVRDTLKQISVSSMFWPLSSSDAPSHAGVGAVTAPTHTSPSSWVCRDTRVRR